MTEKQRKDFKIINGNNLDVLDTLPDNYVDSIITDPPYELGFMGRKWDSTGIAYNVELWKKALRVLKPGGHLLAFGGSRTFHRIACAIEDAGFEIRDCIIWLYGSGFPKSMDVGLQVDKINGIDNRTGEKAKGNQGGGINTFDDDNYVWQKEYEVREAKNEWKGWGTCLKPAFEPIIVARKPIGEANIAQNCLKWGVGGINIDECRVGDKEFHQDAQKSKSKNCYGDRVSVEKDYVGRFPANVITDGSEEVAKGMPNTKSAYEDPNMNHTAKGNKDAFHFGYKMRSGSGYADEGSAMRYFYSAKASKKDRDDGLAMFDAKKVNDGRKTEIDNAFQRGESLRRNVHPTVKPCELMQYLIRLVTPRGGVILDIFNGSGSTGKAAAFENRERNADYKYIGIELQREYVDISLARIDYALNKYEYDIIECANELKEHNQMSIFDFIK